MENDGAVRGEVLQAGAGGGAELFIRGLGFFEVLAGIPLVPGGAGAVDGGGDGFHLAAGKGLGERALENFPRFVAGEGVFQSAAFRPALIEDLQDGLVEAGESLFGEIDAEFFDFEQFVKS